MDFSVTPAQAARRAALVQAAQQQGPQDLSERDEKREWSWESWRVCAGLGLTGLPVAQEYGGAGADATACAHDLEAWGYGCRDNGLNFALGAHLWGCVTPLATFGTDEQKRRYLPQLCAGQWVGGLAMTEREAGSDAYSLTTTATRQDAHYLLNGHKLFVTNAPIANMLLVLATVDASWGVYGVTGFLVEKGTPGLHISAAVVKMGLHTAQMGEVTLENCVVPESQRLGREGAGLALFNHTMEWERGFILAPAVGAMQRQLEDCQQYARTRRQFGQTLGGFQLVSAKLVNMKLRWETARLLLYKFAWLKTQGKSALLEAALVKLHLSESWVASCQDAMQIYGGYGYLSGCDAERDLRDALGSRFYSGTSELQYQVIARLMRL